MEFKKNSETTKDLISEIQSVLPVQDNNKKPQSIQNCTNLAHFCCVSSSVWTSCHLPLLQKHKPKSLNFVKNFGAQLRYFEFS